METSTFFRYRPSWRGIAGVLVFVVITAGVAGVFVYRQPATFRAEANVFVSQIIPADTPDYLLRPIADDYESALALPSVARVAAQKSGASQGAIAGGLSAQQVSSTANLRVLFDSTNPHQGAEVVRAAARQALIELAKLNLSRAQRAAAQTQSAYDAAAAALRQYDAAHGKDGSVQRNQLAGDVDRTQSARDSAANEITTANIELTGATSGDVISVGTPARQSRRQDVVRAAVTAAVIAAMIGLLVLVLLERRRPNRIRWMAPLDRPDPYELPRG